MRLDKFLCDMNVGSRSQVKSLIRQGQLQVNGQIMKDAGFQINENTDIVLLQGKQLRYQKYYYYMLNKPEGYVSATTDPKEKTVLDLLDPTEKRDDLFPAGRLDKDTEGFLLLTNDGSLAHRLLSPGRHVDKTYAVTIAHELSENDISLLEHGIDIGDKQKTLPCKVSITDKNEIQLTLHEGRYHQVKRMLKALNNEVLHLKRISFGGIPLDPALEAGSYRTITEEELQTLWQSCNNPVVSPYHNHNCDMLQGIKAVIFDLDGTLVDSMWMWRDIDVEYLSRFHIKLPENLQANIEGMSFHETAVYFKETFHLTDSLEQIKSDWNQMAWDKYTHEVPLKKGVFDFLRFCKSNNLKLGIATSNSRELVSQIISVHQLNQYFDCIMTSCEVEHGKPSPDIYLAVASALNTVPSECLVFEDIIPGIQAGLNAGMKVCAVEDEYSADMIEEKKALADYYLEGFDQLMESFYNETERYL